MEYPGFMLSSDGIQPQPKKVRAIIDLIAPKTKKQLWRFLGMINYYREMLPSKSARLNPLTMMTSPKATFMWTSAFEGVKKALANAVLLAFSDFTKPSDIYGDASGKQLGGFIQQEGKLIPCYSRSLTSAQLNYTTMELELLLVLEILKEYRTILLGFPVIVHTDYKNLIFSTENSLRVKSSNVGADALSRMEYKQKEVNEDEEITEILIIDPGSKERVSCNINKTTPYKH
ncbi:Gag/polymerase/env Polyprotein [Phytophthora palmivora]|uniref:Gag/polymerase/env Polyprotein n=1 Tax=Phytophthora palmivora TaxID=4796 RepID=A0A2P4X0X1_9STRA|nr:Gag/polymerase/env Polyprotein [Phytophthora palmivora]